MKKILLTLAPVLGSVGMYLARSGPGKAKPRPNRAKPTVVAEETSRTEHREGNILTVTTTRSVTTQEKLI